MPSFTVQVVMTDKDAAQLKAWAQEESRSVSQLCAIVLCKALTEHHAKAKRRAS